ncbi:MAG: DUF2182 domain-containing protein [Gaiellaceae bacterium]
MPSGAALPRPRRSGVAIASVAVALACWAAAVRWLHGMDLGPGTDLGSFPFFIGVWTTMMAAMMLPSALPMLLVFDRVARERRARERPTAPTTVFAATYVGVWAVGGALAFLLYRAVHAVHPSFLAWSAQGRFVAGGAVAAAGIYELSPLKRVCLRHCRGPMHFVLGGWKDGIRGAVAMGVEHGAYCVGCCWGLMLVLFALGVMSVTWMLAVALVVYVQKVLPGGGRLRLPLAVALVAAGAWIALDPGSVPGLTIPA